MKHPVIITSLLALALLAGGPAVHAQQEPEIPEVISPLRVESDHNGVNIVSGKIPFRMPVLSVPGAPNLRFDFVQNAAPYVNGKHSGGETAQASFSVHTITGTSESFRCINFDCSSITGSGSTLSPTGSVYNRGGSGERYQFNLKHVQTTGNPYTTRYYASSVTYPNGEVITFTYDTATLPGQPIQPIFYRPTQVTSNLGYFIAIAYHPGDLESGMWGRPAEAAIYKSSAPTTPLGRLSYSPGGGTITDHGSTTSTADDRVYLCQGCAQALGAGLEGSSGFFQLPDETSPTLEVAEREPEAQDQGVYKVVGSVAQDGVQWNYAYVNLRYGSSLSSYLYDRVTVTGPNGYNTPSTTSRSGTFGTSSRGSPIRSGG